MKKIKSKTKDTVIIYVNEEIELERYSLELVNGLMDIIFKKMKEVVSIN